MDNASESNMPSNGRDFGHCIISWEIKNYGRALWKKNLEIKTPEFTVKGPNSKDTKWKLILKTECNHNSIVEELNVTAKLREKEENPKPKSQKLSEMDFKSRLSEAEKEKFDVLCMNENNVDARLSVKNLMLYLERSCSDEGPDTIFVDWKVYYISIKGEKVSLVHDGHTFNKKIRYGFNIGTLYDFERDFEYNSGLTTIVCDIIVMDINSNKSFNDEINIDLYGLSEDLQFVFDRQMLCDVEISVDGKSVKAHKAMLCSHSDFFKREVEKVSNIVELSDMKYNEVLKILEYMYSHDLKDVIGKPSVCIYNAAIQMNLSDLAAHYVPDEVKINTKIDIKKLTYPWEINDFAKITDCISSDILKNDYDDAAWQISLYPNGIDSKSEYIAITVECIDGNISNDLCIQCAVLRENENLNFWKDLQKAENNDCIVRDTKFILREDLIKLLNNDTLRLGFKVRTCSGEESSIINTQRTPVLYSMKKSFTNMKEKMISLRESNKYADVTFKFGEKEIKAHKFILSARSHLFFRNFEETCNRIHLLNIRPELFEILLDYIYCATFNVSNIKTAIDVYKYAEELLIPRLQEKCSQFLQNSVNVDNALRIFMFAQDHDDKYLRETTEEFIEMNNNAFTCTRRDVKDQKLKAATDPEKDDIVSAARMYKSISVMKCSELCIENYDFELDESFLKGSESLTKVNGEGSGSESLTKVNGEGSGSESLTKENGEGSGSENLTKENGESSSDNIDAAKNLSYETSSECREYVHSNEANRPLAEAQNPIVYNKDCSSKTVQSDKLSVPLKKSYSNGTDSSDSIAETKANEHDNEITYVHIDSKGREIKDPPLYEKSLIKEISQLDSDINASESIKKKDPNELYQSMQLCLKNLQECQKELDAEIAKKKLSGDRLKSLDEQSVSGLKSDIGQNKFPNECSKRDTALCELHGKGQESVDEENRQNLKSNIDRKEPQKESFKLDTALSELHGNVQESLDKQNGNDLQSSVAHETDAALNE